MTVTLGFDVEEFDFPLERGRGIDFGTQLAVSSEGLEFLLDLLARLELRATFYTTANFALHRTDLVRRIVAGGHEVASHDYYHGLTAGSDPAGSRRTLEELTGQRIVGYRAPRLAAASSAALAAAGYRYNSSINPTWIPTRYNNLRAPCSVSREEGLTIYPVSVSAPFRVPLFWISLHVMPLPLYKLLCRSALRRDGHLNLYFHPWEFSARLREPAFGVPGYLTHCSGTDLQRKFIRLLEWLKARGIKTFGAHLGASDFLWNADMSVPCAIVVGSEKDGLGEDWNGLLDCRVKIPMGGISDSMNVNVAAALFLYEALRSKSAL